MKKLLFVLTALCFACLVKGQSKLPVNINEQLYADSLHYEYLANLQETDINNDQIPLLEIYDDDHNNLDMRLNAYNKSIENKKKLLGLSYAARIQSDEEKLKVIAEIEQKKVPTTQEQKKQTVNSLLLSSIIPEPTSEEQILHNSFEGIGMFKLGKTEKELFDSLMNLGYKFPIKETNGVSKVDNMKALLIESKEIYKCIPQDNIFCPYSVCSDVEEFEMPFVNISGFDFLEVSLKFKNDLLYSFQSKCNKELEDALIAKYGEGKVRLKVDTIHCTYTYTGAPVDYQQILNEHKWRADTINFYAFARIWYSNDCQKQFTWTVNYNNENRDHEVKDCEREIGLRKEKDKADKLREKVNGF